MCMSTLMDKTGDMMSFVVDPLDIGYGDKLAKNTTGKISSKLSEEGQRMGFGSVQSGAAPIQGPQQVEEVSARQRRSLIS